MREGGGKNRASKSLGQYIKQPNVHLRESQMEKRGREKGRRNIF